MGIDVYSSDGVINWNIVRTSGHSFGFAKATQGEFHIDKLFHDNVSNMVSSGVIPGAYHYLTADDPVQQALHFVDTTSTLREALWHSIPPAVDIEDASLRGLPNLNAHIAKFLETVEFHTRELCVFYADRNFIIENKIDGFAGHPLWLASWGEDPPDDLPGGWEEWTFWQYSSTGTIPGVASGSLDLDHYCGSEQDLRRWIAGIVSI